MAHKPSNKNRFKTLHKLTLSHTSELLSAVLQILSNKLSSPNKRQSTLEMETEEVTQNCTHDSNLTLETTTSDSVTTNESISIFELASMMNQIEADTILAKKGYKKLHKITDTLQGELIKAVNINDTNNIHYAIKRTEKSLHNQGIAIQDEMNFCVAENIVKESLILKYLTSNSAADGKIVKYIDHFESETDYYLVTEYISSETNLKQFVRNAHNYIDQKQITLKYYQNVIRYVYWQLLIIFKFLHDDMNCCHLDICMENIMLQNCDFIQQNGKYIINPEISVTLIDFGVSEIFEPGNENGFMCSKHNLSLDNASSPQVFSEQLYDSSAADMWSLGHMLHECMSGDRLYQPSELWSECDVKSDSENDKIIDWPWAKSFKNILKMNNTIKYFTPATFDLLNKLLNVNEKERLTA
eukprot:327902_1